MAVDLDFSALHVMAILNVTPDSFFEGSRKADEAAVEARVREAVDEGCTIIDVGGYSSRPGAVEVSEAEEWRRVRTGIAVVRCMAPAMAVSVDTFRSGVIRRAVEEFGSVIVNDITAGEADSELPRLAAQYDLPYIAMHMRGTPATMQSQTDYPEGVTEAVLEYFRAKAAEMKAVGVRRLILDPGFGFAKTVEQNFELLRNLDRLCDLGYPVLAGVSRKSMIWRTLGTTPDESLAGTVALGWECLRQGAMILRVHDVREAVDTIRMFKVYKNRWQ